MVQDHFNGIAGRFTSSSRKGPKCPINLSEGVDESWGGKEWHPEEDDEDNDEKDDEENDDNDDDDEEEEEQEEDSDDDDDDDDADDDQKEEDMVGLCRINPCEHTLTGPGRNRYPKTHPPSKRMILALGGGGQTVQESILLGISAPNINTVYC